MFAWAMRGYRKSFVWLTVSLCLLMALAGLLKPGVLLAAELLEMPELGAALPETNVLLEAAGRGCFLLFGAYSAAMGANILGRRLREGAVSTMASLPVSRGHIVLTHYCAGALYVVLHALFVGAATFGVLCMQGVSAAVGALASLLAPAFGYLLVYSLAFFAAALVKNALVPWLVGAAGLFAAGFAGFVSAGAGTVNGLFVPYASQWSVSAEALLVGALLIACSVLLSLAVYQKKNL